MKVAWFHKFGGPEALVHEEAPTPVPKAGEALVRVRATGINHVDLDHRAGTSRRRGRCATRRCRCGSGQRAALRCPLARQRHSTSVGLVRGFQRHDLIGRRDL
jgi:hypothetical protein